MQIRGGSSHHLPSPVIRSRISLLTLSMLAAMASLYVAGRLWQDSQNRVYLINELDRRTGQGQSAISVDETLKVVACRHQHKRLAALEMELAVARQEGFVGKYYSSNETGMRYGSGTRKRLLAVVGIVTEFGRKTNRDALRKSWVPKGAALKKLEEDKGVVVRFVIGRSANRGDSMDKGIDDENKNTRDITILDNHIESSEETPKKTKRFLVHAANTWDAEFYVKVNDDVYVDIDALGAMLATYWDKPRVYIGCMKSGEVFSEMSNKWYEPDWWKFGDGKSYFWHASGEIFVVSRALAQFISVNRYILRTYAHDDVSVGSWFIGLDVKHVHEGKLCCSSWSSGPSKITSKSKLSSVPSSLTCSTPSTPTAPYSERSYLEATTPRTEGEILSSSNLKAFTFSELKSATRNFRPDSLLGEGGFGYVYKGWIDPQSYAPARPGSGMVVAIKKLKPEGFQGHKEWLGLYVQQCDNVHTNLDLDYYHFFWKYIYTGSFISETLQFAKL